MTLFLLAFAAGVLTILTPCILPIVPFVLARADMPFRRAGLPMLLGLAVTFAVVASLAAFAGSWVVDANLYGRHAALIVMTLFGLAMIFPALATRLMAPVVALGAALTGWAERRATIGGSLLLGVATGLLWAPCAGPVLGVILTGAALHGPGVETSLALLAYGLGAATSLGIGLIFGRRVLNALKRSARWEEGVRRVLGAGVIAGTALIWAGLDTGLLTRLSVSGTTTVEDQLLSTFTPAPAAASTAPVVSGPLADLLRAPQWLNTAPLRAEDLRGKVVLVNFWTYSCINCLRNLPHVRGWAEKYKDQGLVVVGVHTPEFAFEKDVDNVRRAATSLGVTYPVAIDNRFAVWQAFNNQAWPALYFIGADGQVRHRKFGEGEYAQSEKLIQGLLSDAKGKPVAMPIVPAAGMGAQAAPDDSNLRSPETYIGYRQASGFASPGGAHADESRAYRAPSALRLNQWGLDGTWTVGGEFATSDEAGGRIAIRFHARDLHLVLGLASRETPVRFRVTVDGAAPGADHGADVDADGWGEIRDERLYQLVRQTDASKDRVFTIEFAAPGVRAYAFTFG